MIKTIDFFLNKYRPIFQVFALGMFLFSGPLIYFLRDGVGIAKGNILFTVAMMIGPMVISFPFVDYKTLYTPNKLSYKLSFYFIFLGFIYLVLYAPNRGWFTNTYYEIGVMGVIFFLYYYLMTVSFENLNKYFLEFAIAICGLGCFLFLVYLFKNPHFTIGAMRASITFGDSETEGYGNPHIYAKVAYLGMVASVLYFKKPISYIVKIILWLTIFIYIAVLGLTQSMTTIGTLFLFFALYFYFNLSIGQIYSFVKKTTRSYLFWIFLIIVVNKSISFYNENAGAIINVTTSIGKRIGVLGETFFPFFFQEKNLLGKDLNVETRIDDSASARIENFATVKNTFIENLTEFRLLPLLLGNGYHKLYVDIPILEPLHSFGLIGFLLFISFFIYISYQVFKEMRKPQSIATEFIAYAYLYFMLYTFSGGLIIDYIRWGFFAFVCRFLPITKKRSIETKNN